MTSAVTRAGIGDRATTFAALYDYGSSLSLRAFPVISSVSEKSLLSLTPDSSRAFGMTSDQPLGQAGLGFRQQTEWILDVEVFHGQFAGDET